MSELLTHILKSYLPKLLLKHLSDRSPGFTLGHTNLDLEQLPVPSEDRFSCALMFADISGFTKLTEELAKHGSEGAEQLTLLLNQFFTQLIDEVLEHGGDIIKFAGDALLAVWPANQEASLADQTSQASICALAMQKNINRAKITLSPQTLMESYQFDLTIAIGVGNMRLAQLGGVFDRYEFLITGEPLLQTNQATLNAQPGDVVLSQPAWYIVRAHQPNANHVFTENIDGSVTLKKFDHRLKKSLTEQPKKPPSLNPWINKATEKHLKGYIPRAILLRLEAGHKDWLGELRWVTILFINLPDLDYDSELALAQRVMENIQHCTYHLEGSLNKLNVDDKGVSIIAVLGLPPFAHENDAVRGVLVALNIRRRLAEFNVGCAIGISSGRVYCGAVGSAQRREYTVMGAKVNLAARLMQKANVDTILVDETTYQQSKHSINYGCPWQVVIKDITDNETVYFPFDAKDQTEHPLSRDGKTALIGRQYEVNFLVEHLKIFEETGNNCAVFIEGEAGIGKSSVCQAIIEQYNKYPYHSKLVQGYGEAIESNTPFYIWQQIFTQFMNDDHCQHRDFQHHLEHIISHLKPPYNEFGSLLNTILSLSIAETYATQNMSGDIRSSNTIHLMIEILQHFTEQKPIIIILEDAHWLDSASWQLAYQALKQVQPLYLLLFTRPHINKLSKAYTDIRSLNQTQTLILNPLSREDISQLMASTLNCSLVPEKVLDLVMTHAEGHPLHSKEITYVLRDKGIISINRGICSVAPEIDNINTVAIPENIQSILISRIDLLDAHQQLTLKIASVIGRDFSFKLLLRLHPLRKDKLQLKLVLMQLQLEDLIVLSSEPHGATKHYSFKNAIMREVAYDLLSVAHRQELHKRIALILEQQHQADPAQYFSTLAYHWKKSSDSQKALFYLEQAAQYANQTHTYSEAISFIEQAQALWQTRPENNNNNNNNNSLTLVRWEIILGSAIRALGNLPKSRVHFERALSLLGRPVPENPLMLGAHILWRGLRQSFYHLFRAPGKAPDKKQRAMVKERALALVLEQLFIVYYLAGDAMRMLWAALACINYVEKSRLIGSVQCNAHINLALAFGVLPWHSQAAFYNQQALNDLDHETSIETKAWVFLVSGVYACGMGQLEKANQNYQEALALCYQIGYQRRHDAVLVNLATSRFLQGQCYDSLALCETLHSSALERGDVQALGWAILQKARNYYVMKNHETLYQTLKQADSLMQQKQERIDPLTVLDYYALKSLSFLERENYPEAQHWFNQGLYQYQNIGHPILYHFLPALDFLIEAGYLLFIARPNDTDISEQMFELLTHIKRFAKIFPVGRASDHRGRAFYALMKQKKEAALKHLFLSLHWADTMRMHYYSARASLTIASQMDHQPLQQQALIQKARHQLNDLNLPKPKKS